MSALAPVGSIDFRGKVLRFVPVDSLGVREGYELWLIDAAYKSLWARKRFIRTPANPDGFMSQSDWDEEHEATRRDVDAFVYSWGTETWGKSYNSLPGLKKLLSLMLEYGDPRQDIKDTVEALYDLKQTPKEERDRVVNYMLHWGEDPNPEGTESQPAISVPSK